MSNNEADRLADDFETWWQAEGQFSRAGGGDYEKTFAFNAWRTALAKQQAHEATAEPAAVPNADKAEAALAVWDAVKSYADIHALEALALAAQGTQKAESAAFKAWCETCNSQGHIDERLDGEWNSNPKAECPDCDGKGHWIAQANAWSPEDRAAIWFHIPDQFRAGLNAESAGDVAMAVLRLQVAFCEAIEPLNKAEAAPVLAQQFERQDHGKSSDDGRTGDEAALLQRDGSRAEGSGAAGLSQAAVRLVEIAAGAQEGGISGAVGALADQTYSAPQKAEAVARLLHWSGPEWNKPFGGICARTYAEYKPDAGGYWREGAPLYATPPKAEATQADHWVQCIFEGPAPAGYGSWHVWMHSGMKMWVTIKATQAAAGGEHKTRVPLVRVYFKRPGFSEEDSVLIRADDKAENHIRAELITRTEPSGESIIAQATPPAQAVVKDSLTPESALQELADMHQEWGVYGGLSDAKCDWHATFSNECEHCAAALAEAGIKEKTNG